MRPTQEEEEKLFEEEVTNAANSSPKLAILLSHLYVEHLLERLIKTHLQKTDDLFGQNGLSFARKLDLAAAFGSLPEDLINGIKKLNKIRNSCAHLFKYQPTQKEIEELGRTLGKGYTKIKSEYPDDNNYWLGAILPRLCGKLAAVVFLIEKERIQGTSEQ